METMTFVDHFQIWLKAYLILSLFSFLYKDNRFYKFSEHVFAGLSAGYYIGLVWQSIFLQQLINPIFDLGQWWLVFPGFLGLLMFTRLSSNYSWISRVSLAFVMGNTAGIFIITELHGKAIPQVLATMIPLNGDGGIASTILALIVIVGVISTLIYFYFSKEHTGLMGMTAKLGIWFIMIAFGAHFGYTVMGRISLLIGRVEFLYYNWGHSLLSLF